MPARCPGSTQLRFDRTVRGVGRIQNSAGTASLTEFHVRNAILTKLIRARALDILRAFKTGRLSIGDLVTADRQQRLLQVADEMRLARPLKTTVETWLPTSAREPESRRRYAVSWRAVWAKAAGQLRPNATVRDLELLDWRRLMRVWGTSGADWNRMRAMLSAFLTDFTGHVHAPFRLAVMGRLPRGRESRGRVPDLSVVDFWKLVMATPEHVRAVYVAFAALGCGQKEFDGVRPEDLNAERREVKLNSAKGPDRARTVAVEDWLWPWVVRAFQSPLQEGWRRRHFNDARTTIGQPNLTMYDLRHLGAQLAMDRGVSLRDVATHLGHSDVKMTMRYARRRQARGVSEAIGAALKEGAG